MSVGEPVKFVTRRYGAVKPVNGGAALKQALSEAKAAPVVVDFFATWCGPCQMMEPELNKLAAEFPEVMFLKMDGDANKALVRALGVGGYPTFRVYRFGKKLQDVVGARLPELRAAISSAVGAWQSGVLAPSMVFAEGSDGRLALEETLSPDQLSVVRNGRPGGAPAPAPAAAAAGAAAPPAAGQAGPLTFKQAIDILEASNSRAAVVDALRILAKTVGNVVDNPAEGKYRSIRVQNRLFQDKVASCRGGLDCMVAMGFTSQRGPLPGVSGDASQEYLVLRDVDSALPKLKVARMMLQSRQRALGGGQ